MPRVPGVLRPVLSLLVISAILAGCAGQTANVAGATATPPGGGALPGWPLPGQITMSGPVPVIASSQLAVGKNRFLFTLVDQTNKPIASPDMKAKLMFYDLDRDPAHPYASADGRFLWAIPNERGFYVAQATFDAPGNWGVQVDTSGAGKSASTRVRFDVLAKASGIQVGDKAPDVASPTLADAGGNVRAISSDPSPDPALYQVSVSHALAEHKPFVLIFATPAFCTSQVCGPTLDEIKAVAAQEPGFTFINAEPYELTYSGGRLQPVLDKNGNLTPTKLTDAWGIQQEPWTFVVDGQGVVRYSFEAVFGADELKAAVDSVK